MAENVISVSGGAAALLSDELARVAQRVQRGVARVRSGSGFGAGTVWRADGIVITNHHVVAGSGAEVVLDDGRRFDARVIARDPSNDLAVLRVAANDLPALPVRDARSLRPGELVIAVGHPVGMVGAASVGIVSAALPASPEQDERELVRADVLLRPGNSGGPLVDAAGHVLGVNAMVMGSLSLSVPSHLVARLLAAQERPLLGVGVQETALQPALAAAAAAARGLLVVSLTAGGAAERAGLLVGDILLSLDDHALPEPTALLAALADAPAGSVRLRLLRGGTPRELSVSLLGRAEQRAA
jgi:serine protease Do